MSELGTELRRVAMEAGGRAWPVPVADVIRRGQQRRRRAMARRLAGGVSVAGLAGVMIVTGVAGGAPAGPAASGTAHGVLTVTQTASSAAGTMTVQVKYRNPRRARIMPLSVTFSGTSAVAVRRPAVVVVFGQPMPTLPPSKAAPPDPSTANRRPRMFIFVISLRPNGLRQFSGTLPRRDIRAINHAGGLPVNDTALITLATKIRVTPRTVALRPLMQDGLILTPRLR
jgi:hypothetical protein